MGHIRRHQLTATVGIYRLTMQHEPSPLKKLEPVRHRSTREIIQTFSAWGAKVLLYEPVLVDGCPFYSATVLNDLSAFKQMSTLIIANQYADELDDVAVKVIRRDLLARDGNMVAHGEQYIARMLHCKRMG